MTSKLLRYLLIAIIIFLSISGLFGGISLIIDPLGSNLQLSTDFLESTMFKNYLFPGIILLLFLGIFPAITAYGLIIKRKLKTADKINIYKKKHWAWTYSLYCGIILVLWIDLQVMMIGGGYILQSIYAIIGVIVIVITLSPQIMKFYKKS